MPGRPEAGILPGCPFSANRRALSGPPAHYGIDFLSERNLSLLFPLLSISNPETFLTKNICEWEKSMQIIFSTTERKRTANGHAAQRRPPGDRSPAPRPSTPVHEFPNNQCLMSAPGQGGGSRRCWASSTDANTVLVWTARAECSYTVKKQVTENKR